MREGELQQVRFAVEAELVLVTYNFRRTDTNIWNVDMYVDELFVLCYVEPGQDHTICRVCEPLAMVYTQKGNPTQEVGINAIL